MDLEFEIDNQILKRTDTETLFNKDYDNYTCNVTFTETDDSVDKFIIFTDGWNNKITIHLTEDENYSCPLPNRMLRGSLFKVTVYDGELKTNQLTIPLSFKSYPKTENNTELVEDDYEYDAHTGVVIDCPKPIPYPHHHSGCDDGVICNTNEVDVFLEIYNTLRTLINRVEYNDKEVLFYNDNTLIETVSLPFLTKNEIQRLITQYIEEDLLNNLPIASSSQQGLLSASDKEKLDNLSNVALTGDYNDLNNIPLSFNPSPHNHLWKM